LHNVSCLPLSLVISSFYTNNINGSLRFQPTFTLMLYSILVCQSVRMTKDVLSFDSSIIYRMSQFYIFHSFIMLRPTNTNVQICVGASYTIRLSEGHTYKSTDLYCWPYFSPLYLSLMSFLSMTHIHLECGLAASSFYIYAARHV